MKGHIHSCVDSAGRLPVSASPVFRSGLRPPSVAPELIPTAQELPIFIGKRGGPSLELGSFVFCPPRVRGCKR